MQDIQGRASWGWGRGRRESQRKGPGVCLWHNQEASVAKWREQGVERNETGDVTRARSHGAFCKNFGFYSR